jgi:endonuclease I
VSLACTATDNVDGSVACTYSGTVNTNVAGSYIITYSATDSSSNTATLEVTYTITDETDPLTMDLSTYYDDAEGLTGEQLLEVLRLIINSGFIGVSYGDSRYILDETDADPNNPGNLILVYLQTSVDGTWDDGTTWNREHVWPQSLMGVSVDNSSVNIGSDLHNLKPANPSENSSRGNEYFDNFDTASTYEPPDASKGDIARILFYMMVMYDYLNLVDEAPTLYEMALLEVLLAWHEADPVDAFEQNRNNVIYFYQFNRNPFIDYPHFVELIFGSHPYYS